MRQSYRRVLQAHIAVLESGKAPTFVNLAKELHRTRQAVSQLYQRHPDLAPWIARQVDAAVGHHVPSVLHRHAMLAIQGSVESAKVYLTALGIGGFGRSGGRLLGDPDDPDDLSETNYVVNILVPHPELPNGGRVPPVKRELLTGPGGVPLPADIPTVAVR